MPRVGIGKVSLSADGEVLRSGLRSGPEWPDSPRKRAHRGRLEAAMIPRYSRPAMAAIWTEKNRYLTWLKVELAVSQQLASEGVIPRRGWQELRAAAEKLIAKGGVDPARVEELEKTT